jgi:hypothetical protein
VKEKSSEGDKVFAKQRDRKVVIARKKVREKIHVKGAPRAKEILVSFRMCEGKVKDAFEDAYDVRKRRHDEGRLGCLKDVVTERAAKVIDVSVAVLTECSTLFNELLMRTGDKDVFKVFNLRAGGAESRIRGVPEDTFASSDYPVPEETNIGGTSGERFSAESKGFTGKGDRAIRPGEVMKVLAARSQGDTRVVVDVASCSIRSKFNERPRRFGVIKFWKSRGAGRPVKGVFG